MSESDFSAFLARARERVRTSCRLGGFARDADQTDADLYGTAAAVGVRIALGDAPRGAEASEIVRGLLAFRRADGLFIDETHGPVHRAATAVTTIRALGGEPEPPPALRHELEASRVPAFLDGLSWENPWLASHDAAGMLAIALICRSDDEASREAWRDAYVTWLDDHADGQTGLWPANGMGRLHDEPGLFGNLGCSFHIHFLYEWIGHSWPSPERVVDTGLTLFEETDTVISRGSAPVDWGFRQLDWVYSVGRAARCGHRVAEVDDAIQRLARRAAEAFADPSAVDGDLHVVQARVGLVAELAQHVSARVQTDLSRPLVSIVDERPFI